MLSSRFLFLLRRPPPLSTLFPYTTLFRSLLPTSTLPVATATPPDPGEYRALSVVCPNHLAWNPALIFNRSEEHTSELQSQSNLVCRLLLEKKKKSGYESKIVDLAFGMLTS